MSTYRYELMLKRMALRKQRRIRRQDPDKRVYARIDACRLVYPRFQEGAYHE